MPYVFRYKGKRFFSVITQGKSTWKFFVQKTLLNVCFEIKIATFVNPTIQITIK